MALTTMVCMILWVIVAMTIKNPPSSSFVSAQKIDRQYSSLDTSFAVVFVVVFMAGLFGCIAYTLYNLHFHPVDLKRLPIKKQET